MEGFYRGQCAVLEQVARGAALSEVLEGIVRLIEGEASMGCSIVLLSDDGKQIFHGAAPTLPQEYVRLLDGLEVGPEAGSCGAAAFYGTRVIVEDIATHPNWVAYREFALPHGLRACWSEPIRAPEGTVLGTFAMYYREPRGPTDREIELVTTAAHLASVAIVKDRTIRNLKLSEERLRAVIETTPDVSIQWYDAGGRILFANAASYRMFGWKPEALGKTLLEIGFWSEAEERLFADSRAAAATGSPPPPIEFTFRRPDGSTGYLLSTVFMIPYGAGASAFVCMDVDLTERRRSEEVARTEEALRARIYTNVVDPIFCLGVEDGERYRFLSVNPAFLHATGLREEQIVGKEVREVIPEPSCTMVLGKYREAIATGRAVRWEEITPYPTGVRHGDVTVDPIFDATGRCTILVGGVHDITGIRKSEAERRELEARLQQGHRLQSLGTLASGIAHDFNNVLGAISSYTELALTDGADVRANLLELQKATRRAAGLVRQILVFGRKQEARKERTDLRGVVDEVLDLARATITPGVKLTRQPSPEPVEAQVDSTQVHQVVMNLVTNAVHAVHNSGVIEIEIGVCEGDGVPAELGSGRYARISVSDNGQGMDEATRARAFDPFFTTKPQGEGTGLGLSIVHGIMRAHDGAVTVRSRLGAGTTFDLYFPMAQEAAAAPSPGHGQRVMLVDDEEAIVFLGTRLLTKLGFRVSGHANPSRALEAFRERPGEFDAVISDVSMPGMSGVALLAEVRRIRPDVAVILTSGHIHADDIEAAHRSGLGDPILKPHTIEEYAWAMSRAR